MTAETQHLQEALAANEAATRELQDSPGDRHVSGSQGAGQFGPWQAIARVSSAALTSTSVDELLNCVLVVLAGVASADIGVLRVRDGERLRSMAAVGLEEEVAAQFSVDLHEGLPDPLVSTNGHAAFSSAATGAWSPYISKRGVQRLYCLPLLDGKEVVAAVYLGTLDGREFSEEDQLAIAGVARSVTAALARLAEYDSLRQGISFRDNVLAMVAHDLRNPINVVALSANALLQRLTDPSERRPLERIVRAVQRAERLIQDLLDITAIEAGRFSIETHTVEIADTILAALESQQSLAADASIIIATDISPSLPPIEADQERVFEVLENLIGNAMKFTSPGGSVTVGACAEESEILFWVKDSGEGIRDDDLIHLFDRFWQASKQKRKGTGLGLSICKAIVEAHGGRIWAESKPGQGTTMFFTVPAAERSLVPEAVQTASILLVDDRPENLLSLKAILERPDYRLVTASSGKDALSLALREPFAVALIDIAMPIMNGLEVAVHLKELERTRDIPIIFITAFGDDPEEVHRAYSAGGADYLVKPLDSEIVRKKVAVFVDLSRRRHARRR